MHQLAGQIPPRWCPKSFKIQVLGGPGAFFWVSWGLLESSWGGLGAILAPRGTKTPKRRAKGDRVRPPRTPKLGPKSIKICPKSDPKGNHFFDYFLDRLEAIWCQLGSNLAPKTLPKWSQVGCKIDASWDVDLRVVFEGLLAAFLIIFYFNMAWPK